MKWYNYLACFVAGVFLIHILPHLLNGFSARNVVGVLVSLVGGCLLLWAGKFSFRNLWTVILVVAGMGSVFLFLAIHPHKHDDPPHATNRSAPVVPDRTISISCNIGLS
jgi:hypothetical protein